jgi:uncharacterized protein (DUF1778 family)
VSRHTRAEAPSVTTSTRLSPAERDRVEHAARVNHQSLSQFQRDALLDRADRTLDSELPTRHS